MRFFALPRFWTGAFVVAAASVIAGEPNAAPPPAGSAHPWAVEYDRDLTAGFFKKEKWNWPPFIVEHDDGHLENTLGGSTKGVKKLLHTAEVTSSCLGEHIVNFANAWLERDGRFGIFVNEFNPAYLDELLLVVRDGNFSAQFTTVYKFFPAQAEKWVATRATLKLDKKQYAVGDVVKGELDVEFVEEPSKRIIKLKGYIKPKVIAKRPDCVTAAGVLLSYQQRGLKSADASGPQKKVAN